MNNFTPLHDRQKAGAIVSPSSVVHLHMARSKCQLRVTKSAKLLCWHAQVQLLTQGCSPPDG